MHIGDTTIVAGVNGPMEAKSQKMAYDKLSIEVTYTPLTGPASKLIGKLNTLWITVSVLFINYFRGRWQINWNIYKRDLWICNTGFVAS